MKAISLFSSAGIGELFLKNIGIDIIASNELIKKRSDCYKFFYPETEVIQGDIRDDKVKREIIKKIDPSVKLLIATPPCQGLSTLGKNKLQNHLVLDPRNYLIYNTLEVIDAGNFDYILIENVARFLDMYFPYKSDLFDVNLLTLEDILNKKYGNSYNIEAKVLNAKDYGISQTRPRAIIKLFKKGLKWAWPEIEPEIPLKDSIGHLPSLESGEKSDILWHEAKEHNPRAVLALKHTPTGKSALKNELHYPKKENGERIKGFHNTFKRMSWDEPAHARTTYCGSISSHNNVHPGRKLNDGTYSDARVLTLLETFIVSSIPETIKFPDWANESFIRTVIGECVPPLMLQKILSKIGQ
ncbi:DNA cytosine methyltransferase [Pontibacter burrus]|uniref:DNA (cytosine-5-)-methyltransferase n=1 Tax=Pontibacter burrus TaxID=2704466 RepID=A0A6B3LR83_9BACT|nr:DNA cytosine methyltransferase [Pontibacter burrus]NEM98353.1 DNA cytosine methyltransferase [Pontibacter burrus]